MSTPQRELDQQEYQHTVCMAHLTADFWMAARGDLVPDFWLTRLPGVEGGS